MQSTSGSQALLSIVIPTVNEAGTLPRLLADLAPWSVPREVVVSDGSSSDATREVARAAGAHVLEGTRGRGAQLRRGAEHSRGEWFLFLHADTRLPPDAEPCLRHAMACPPGAWAFRLGIDAPATTYRVIEFGANIRSRLLGLPYGDQGLLLPRSLYYAAGGFPDVPLMEDVALARALAPLGGIALLPAAVGVSARRWERDGVWRRSFRNLWILARWYSGVSPSTLAAEYERPLK